MKISIEINDNLKENELVISCRQLTPEIIEMQRLMQNKNKENRCMLLYRNETEYYLPIEDLLFFQTDGIEIQAHTANEIFITKSKLYELEESLPAYFARISKSAIVNCKKIFSLNRNLTAASLIEFQNTHKQIYVSRAYYKMLKQKLEEMRLK